MRISDKRFGTDTGFEDLPALPSRFVVHQRVIGTPGSHAVLRGVTQRELISRAAVLGKGESSASPVSQVDADAFSGQGY